MINIETVPEAAGLITVKEASSILKITEKRVQQLIRAGRLPVAKVGTLYLLAEKDVRSYQRRPGGRPRTNTPDWRIINPLSKVQTRQILVPVRPGQQATLVDKLRDIQHEEWFQFKGTIARVINQADSEFNTLELYFVWKDTDLPDQLSDLPAFATLQATFANELDWSAAEYHTSGTILYT